jgi:hypothetical protein
MVKEKAVIKYQKYDKVKDTRDKIKKAIKLEDRVKAIEDFLNLR